MDNQKFITVTALNRYISYKFDVDVNLQEIYLQGEISNFKKTGKHCYFSLKDENAEISAMFFYPNNLSLRFTPQDGMNVQVVGKIQVYQKRGTYAVIVNKMVQDGVGLLYQEFIELKEKLAKEGLFDEERKLPIPEFPRCVAVITAATGDAIHDIISTFNRRLPLAKIKLFPALVQGADAPRSLIEALNRVYQDPEIDVLIIGRGGGSFEDLSCFNNETLVRVLANAKIPSVSAIGHEADYTICDFIASYRAPTPTGAAMRLTKDRADISNQILSYAKRLASSAKNKLIYDYKNFENINEKLSLLTPEKMAENLENNINNLYLRTDSSFQNIIKQAFLKYQGLNGRLRKEIIEEKITKDYQNINKLVIKLYHDFENNYLFKEKRYEQLIEKVVLLNPFNIMKRGYSIIYQNNDIVSSVKKVNIDSPIKVRMTDGMIIANIIDKSEE